jgi:uncharacterized protein
MMFTFAENLLKQSLQGVNREDLPYIQTYYGKKYRHMWPLPEDICIEDIAHGLSNTCRFTGQIKTFYSVAEHAVRGSYYCPEPYKFDFLHHDDGEAYCVDVPRPLKRAPGMEVYRMYENMTNKAIQDHFKLGPEPEVVKQIDGRMLETEARDLFYTDCAWVGHFGAPFDDKIEPWTPEKARRRYLMRHYELSGEREFYKKYEHHEKQSG